MIDRRGEGKKANPIEMFLKSFAFRNPNNEWSQHIEYGIAKHDFNFGSSFPFV